MTPPSANASNTTLHHQPYQKLVLPGKSGSGAAETGDGVHVLFLQEPHAPKNGKNLKGPLAMLIHDAASGSSSRQHRHAVTNPARRIGHGANNGYTSVSQSGRAGAGKPLLELPNGHAGANAHEHLVCQGSTHGVAVQHAGCHLRLHARNGI